MKNSSASNSSIDATEKIFYSVQLKLLEIARHLFLLNEESPEYARHKAAKDTLFTLGESFHEVTKHRR